MSDKTAVVIDAKLMFGTPLGYSSPLEWGRKLRCPICEDENVHFDSVFTQDSQDNYEAWNGRGDAARIEMWCENGCRWVLCFGSHKGAMFLKVENPVKQEVA